MIIPLAFLTFLFYTFYFPYMAKCVVERSRPCVDPYNESGEKRTEIDAEYNRLMDADTSPYNFLYNVRSRGNQS